MKMKFPLLCTLSLLIAPYLAQADQVQVLDRGDQSLSAFYQSIHNAKESIDLATFIFEPCESAPKLLLDALVKKAQAGVKVRILVDAYSLKPENKAGLPAYLASIRNASIEIKYYNDAATFFTVNQRSHIKAFIVDGNIQIVGGRNMSDDYFGLGSKMNYVDQDVLVVGDSAKDAKADFERLWAAGDKASPQGGDAKAFQASCLKQNDRDQLVAQMLSEKSAALLSARSVHSCQNVKYAADRPDFAVGSVPFGDPLSDARLARKLTTQMFL